MKAILLNLLALILIANTVWGSEWSLGKFTLMQSIPEVRALCVELTPSDGVGTIMTSYEADMGDVYNWELTFSDFDGEQELIIISMRKQNATYEDYLELCKFYTRTKGYPSRVNVPGVLPTYSTFWYTEYTIFDVTYAPNVDRVILTLKLDLW